MFTIKGRLVGIDHCEGSEKQYCYDLKNGTSHILVESENKLELDIGKNYSIKFLAKERPTKAAILAKKKATRRKK